MDPPSTSPPKVPPRVSERYADITLRSGDGILFKFYRKHLEVHSTVFEGAKDFATDSTHSVDLEESSEVLDLLLQFMWRQTQPDLTSVNFEILAPLSEAAEKYEVFAAIPACKTGMRAAAINHPLEVLEYAVRHGYADIMDAAARYSIGCRMDEVIQHLSIPTLLLWLRYFQFWLDVMNTTRQFFPRHSHKGSRCWCARLGVEVLKDLSNIDFHDTVFPDLKAMISSKVAAIPQFSSMIR